MELHAPYRMQEAGMPAAKELTLGLRPDVGLQKRHIKSSV